MDELQLYQQVEKNYQKIIDKWLHFHMHLLLICTIIGGLLEMVMFFVIVETNTLTITVGQYWLKYMIIPIVINTVITVIGYFVYKSKVISTGLKQYTISFLFSMFAFVLLLAHSGFVAVLVCGILPILMTVMYENKRLTTGVTIFCTLSQIIGGNATFWDNEKVLNQPYFINLIILVSATFCVWLACCSMIRFISLKREIIIGNDIERYLLQERINIDGLTHVGNKHALIKMLEEASIGVVRISYLAMIDIDDFKKINDTYGHPFGDDVLRCLGDGMRALTVEAHSFRYGGDEFCILFVEPSIHRVVQSIKDLQEYLKICMQNQNENVAIYASVGIAVYSDQEDSGEILGQADEALYRSKESCRGQIMVYKKRGEFIGM